MTRARPVIEKMVREYHDEILSIQPAHNSLKFVRLIENSSYWDRVETWQKKIEMPTKMIGRLESDDATIEIVMDCYIDLYEYYEDDKKIQKLVVQRWNYLAKDVHRAAFLLNHNRAMNMKYLPDEELKCFTAMTKEADAIGIEMNDDKFDDKVIQELPKYFQMMRDVNEDQSVRLAKLSSREFWDLIGKTKFPSLFIMSHKLFGLASSAPSKRTWSILKFLHNRLRNRLRDDKIDKMLFIRINEALHDPNIDIDIFLEDLEDEIDQSEHELQQEL